MRDDKKQVLSTGDFADETASAAEFDRLIEETGCFRIYREVLGYPVQPRLNTELKWLRIDRVLSPTKKLLDAKWPYGPIGVELKRSGEKINLPLAQLLDYSRVVWRLPRGFNAVLDLFFLWPFEKQAGAIASIMAQHRVGTVETTRWDTLKFCIGELVPLRVGADGVINITPLPSGRKAGSR